MLLTSAQAFIPEGVDSLWSAPGAGREPCAPRSHADWTEGYRKFWEERFEALDSLLEELKAEGKQPGHAKR
jgi:hypothetical protein